MATNSTYLYCSNYPSSSPYTLTASVVVNSQSTAGNTSNVTITASITSGGAHFSDYSTPTLSVLYKDNNSTPNYVTKATEQISAITSGTPSRSVTWTGDVPHKADGTLSITVKAAWNYKSSGTGFAPVTGEVEVSLVPTTIPRAGNVSISPTSATIATKNNTTIFTATVTPQSTAYYHQISATCNGTSCMTAVWAEDNSYKGFIRDNNLLTALGNNVTGTVVVTVKTYSAKNTSSTLIGTKTASANVTVNTSVIKPSLSSTSISIKTTPISSYLVAGYSTANVNFTVAAGNGATSCTTTVTLSNGTMATATATGTGAKTLATNAVPESSSDYTLTATITAVDGRGATATATATYTVKGYTKPVITADAYRVDANGSSTADEQGGYAQITFSATYKALGNNSIQSLSATYTGGVSGTLTTSPSWVALTETQGITITVTATDRVTSISSVISVAVAILPIDAYQDGADVAIGLGGPAQNAGWLNNYLDMRMGTNAAPKQIRFYATNGYVNFKADSSVSAARTINLPNKSGTVALAGDDLPLAGGTMTGQILTSYRNSVAMGSYGTAQTTVDGFVGEVRFSSGCMGSVSIGTAYTKDGVTIPVGWYNFIYSPHRSGGMNGSASGDNCNYGNLFLMGMNNTNGFFRVRVSSSAVAGVTELEPKTAKSTAFTNNNTTNYRLNGTAGTNYFYVTYGSMVFVTFNVYCVSAAQWPANMSFKGLPAPLLNGADAVFCTLGDQAVGGNSMIAAIQSDGTVQCTGGTTGHYYYGTGVYIKA